VGASAIIPLLSLAITTASTGYAIASRPKPPPLPRNPVMPGASQNLDAAAQEAANTGQSREAEDRRARRARQTQTVLSQGQGQGLGVVEQASLTPTARKTVLG